MKTLLFSLFFVACKGTPSPDDTSVSGEPDWSLMADQVSSGVLLSMWAPSETEVLMVGGGMLKEGPGVLVRYRPEERTLCQETLLEDSALWWIHGSGADPEEWYAVGEKGTILHHTAADGLVDESVDYSGTFYGVWDDGDTTWAVGGRLGGSATGSGAIWRKDESGWAVFEQELPGVIFKVWDGHFVGNEVAYRLADGETLEEISPGETKLLTLRGRDDSDIWAVGGAHSAEVLHFDGAAWSSIQTAGLGLPLMGVWTAPGEAVWVSGMSGVQGFSEDQGENWTIPNFPITSNSFHAVLKHGEEVLFAGGNLMSTGPDYHGTIGRYGPEKTLISATDCQ